MRKNALWALVVLPGLCAAGLLAIEHARARQVSPADPPPLTAGAPAPKFGLPSYPATLQPSEPAELPPADPPALAQFDPPALPLPAGETPDDPPGVLSPIPPDPTALPAADPTPLPADPVEQVGALTERIQVRRAEDVASVQALVEQLAAQAEVQRAALARTEEALQAARALEGELTGEAPRIDPEAVELPEPPLDPIPR